MKILAITDLHGSSVDRLLDFEAVDLVLVLGDITTGESLKDTQDRINPLRETYPLLYAIPGNWDRRESRQWLKDEGISFDRKSLALERLLLFGVGGSTPTPFNTPNEFEEVDFAVRLSSYPESDESGTKVLCSHNPPYGTCDKTLLGKHVGSKFLRSFIEDKQPDLVLCGHIHEGRGRDRIGNTLVVNPGPAPRHYALIDIDDEIKAALV